MIVLGLNETVMFFFLPIITKNVLKVTLTVFGLIFLYNRESKKYGTVQSQTIGFARLGSE